MITYGIENHTCQEIDNNRILGYMSTLGYNDDVLMDILNDDKFETTYKCGFNCAIRDIIKQNHIPMFDVIIFIEKNFVDGKRVWDTILDNRNKEQLKKEVSESYHIKLSECSIEDFFS